MENYIERFKRTTDPEEIREILKEIQDEDLPLERVIPPRIVASKIMEMDQLDLMADLIRILDEEGYETYWDAYIPYEFFVDKISESDDIGDIGILLSELIDVGYPDFWISDQFFLPEILEKVTESADYQDVLRYYLGFLRGGHKQLKGYLRKRMTPDSILSLLKRVGDLCDLVLIIYFVLQLEGKPPKLPFSEERMKELLEESPLRCTTEFLYLSGRVNKNWRRLILPYLKDIEREEEEFSEFLDFFEEVVSIYDPNKKEPIEVLEVFAPEIMNHLKDREVDLIDLSRGITLLQKVFLGLNFIDELYIWERFSKRWPPDAIVSFFITLIEMGYPISKIPKETILHYLTYYHLFPSFLYYSEELFFRVKTYRDRFVALLRDMVHLYGEKRLLEELVDLHPERSLPTLGFLRTTVDILNDLTKYPSFVKRFVNKFTQLSEVEEFSSMLEPEENKLLLSFIDPKKIRDFILSSEGLSEVNMFLWRFLNFQDRFSSMIIRVLDEFTPEDMGMLFSLEENTENIKNFLTIIGKIFSERKHTFGRKIPPHVILERLYNVERLGELVEIFDLLLDIGFDREEIKGEFLRGFFTRDDIPLYGEWGLFYTSLRERDREFIYEDLLPEEGEGYSVDGDEHPHGYGSLFYPLLSFYRDLLERKIGGDWIRGFTIEEIKEIISVTRIEFITAFLELLLYGGYPRREIYALEPRLFVRIMRNETNGVTSLFMKKRLLDVLSFWGYPMDWIKRLSEEDLIRMFQKEKDFRDLDIFLLTLLDLGMPEKRVMNVLFSRDFYAILKDLKGENIARILKVYALLDFPVSERVSELIVEKLNTQHTSLQGLDIYTQGYPLVKRLSGFPEKFFMRELIEKKYYKILTDEHYYRTFVRLITYLRKRDYDKLLKKTFLSNPLKKMGREDEEELFSEFFSEDTLN